MSREIAKLTSIKLDGLRRQTGMHADGGGLYLQVKNGGASWVLRYQLAGRARWMGLGPLALFGLREARVKALDARRLKHEGIDPVEAKRARHQQMRLDAARAITFSDAAEAHIASHKVAWRNAKHAAQWSATLATYAEPSIGGLPVQAIDTALVMKVLEPIWVSKPETASRLRGRIEAVLGWAKARGYRTDENPARWRGHLDKLLPARGKVRRVKHHAALPYDDVPGFVAALREQEGIAARALEFTILTAARTAETLGVSWGEFNLADRVWTLPAERMKAGNPHRVPLTARTTEILKSVKPEHVDPKSFVFVGGTAGKPLSNMAMTMTLRRMGRTDLTVHGFRSSFRDWAAERTNFPGELAEMALAHTVSDKVEAAYRRGDMFERRRRMMAEWSEFCGTLRQGKSGTIAFLHKRA